MDWQQFVMNLESLDPTDVENVLLRFGACSVTLCDAADSPVLEPAPGETPLWPSTRISGLFDAAIDLDRLEQTLQTELGVERLPPHRIETLPDRQWEREWLKDLGPQRFGRRLWVAPHDSEVDDGDAAVVRLDPGLAFGTGTHATTALCLEWLDGLALQGKSMLDYGCGSGILAIAALKLGCRSAVAMDIDPQAVAATARNAQANGVEGSLQILSSPQQIQGAFDLIIANILAGPLVEFAESITSALGSRGMLALSGVLCEQAPDVMSAYEPWIDFEEPVFREQDGQTWSRLAGKRR